MYIISRIFIIYIYIYGSIKIYSFNKCAKLAMFMANPHISNSVICYIIFLKFD